MKRFFGLPTGLACAELEGGVVTLGMFDGVHRGHRSVLDELCRQADLLQAPSVILTFDRHPRVVVNPQKNPAMITSLEHRLALFADRPITATLVLPFSDELAAMDGETFLRRLLLDRLQARHIVLGHDTHFGKARSGNIDLLARLKTDLDYGLSDIPAVLHEGAPVSSTRIRRAVEAGGLQAAADMLGRPVSALGTVVYGKGLGRQLGFRTLNLDLHHELHPPQGVYFSETAVGATVWPSATFIGRRPASHPCNATDVIIESHILGGDIGDLYGQNVTVNFLHHHRPIQSFPSPEALKAAITADVSAARDFHAHRNL